MEGSTAIERSTDGQSLHKLSSVTLSRSGLLHFSLAREQVCIFRSSLADTFHPIFTTSSAPLSPAVVCRLFSVASLSVQESPRSTILSYSFRLISFDRRRIIPRVRSLDLINEQKWVKRESCEFSFGVKIYTRRQCSARDARNSIVLLQRE